MFVIVLEDRLLPMSMKFPPGTISRRYPRICDSLIWLSFAEFAVEYLKWLLSQFASTAATSFGEVPVPLNKRMGAASLEVLSVDPAEAFSRFTESRPWSRRSSHAVNAAKISSDA